MGNFNFLLENPDFDTFSKLAIESENQYNKNIMFCGVSGRKALEQAVLWMYSVDGDLKMPYNDNLQSLIHEATFIKIVPYYILKDLQIIIKVGNAAVHSNEDVEKQKAFLSLKALFNFMKWIDYTYSPNAYKETKFDENLIPAGKARIKLKGTKDEINKYKQELKNQEKTIQELKKLLADKKDIIKERRTSENKKIDFNPDYISEKETRDLFIDSDLESNGWCFDDFMVKREYPVKNMGYDKKNGFVDYVLFGKDGMPLAVVEAKKTSKDPNVGKQQSKDYADCIEKEYGRRPFIFYTNGFECIFWDDTQAAPRYVSMIFSQDDLQKLMDRRSQVKDINQIKINMDIAGRGYQQEAIKAIEHSLLNDRRRFLLVMATGTGKTRTAASLVDVLHRANYVINVLFLADRKELVTQAHGAFTNYLPNMSLCNLLDSRDRKDKINARVVFSTYQTIMHVVDSEKDENNATIFTPAHFDLIIVDEAHRSIFKKYKSIFDYFDSYVVGLTATPREDVDRNTYEFFGRANGDPDSYYSYEKAIEEKFLVPYKVIKNSTTFLEEGILKSNLAEEDKEKLDEEEFENFEEFPPSYINKYVTDIDTIKKVITELMDHGIKTNGGDSIGKTIIFAYNKNHAQAIVDVYNDMYKSQKGEEIARIVCDDSKVDETMKTFKNADSKLKIAVSVDMLDTGIDIPEVVNLVFFKKVRSKIKFDQMIGRGTRLCPDLLCTDDKYGTYIGKKYFYIFDWLRNFETFEKKYEEKDVKIPKSINEVLFSRRCKIIRLLQGEEYISDEFFNFRKDLVDTVCSQVKALDINKAEIRLVRRDVLRFCDKNNFQSLNEDDMSILTLNLAPLVADSDKDFYAKGFDNAIYSFMISKMEGENYTTVKNHLIDISTKLLKKHTIPQVREKISEIKELGYEETYRDKPLYELEKLRIDLRDLISFIVEGGIRFKIVDFIDTLIKGNDGRMSDDDEVPVTTISFEEYEKRVNSYIAEHLDEPAITKLRNNEKITQDDLDSLNKVFTEDLGNQEYFDRMREDRSLGIFVRSIAKMDREKINDLFANAMNEGNWNIKQIQFVKKIIDIIIEQGEINMERLYEGRIPFNRPGTLFSLFGEKQRGVLVNLINDINNNAQVA